MSTKLSDLTTPCFVVDINKLRNNAKRMRETCKQLGLSLRPHTKTHKTVEAAEIQTEGSLRGLTVSTLPEAEVYADAGFDDILLAHPINEKKIERCISLIKRLEKFIVMISDPEGLKCLQRNQHLLPEGKTWSAVIEIDTGYKRSGFPWNSQELVDVAGDLIKSMTFVGLYCHCGSSYDLENAKARVDNQRLVSDCLVSVRERIKTAYPKVPEFIIGTGSTPSCSLASKWHRKLDEFHPGNYIFYDMEQYLLNACRQSDIAGRVMTRVIAHKPEEHMLLVDCGFLGVSLDGIQRCEDDFCVFDGETNLKMINMSQELGKVKAKVGELDCRNYPVGTILFILPFHSCNSAAMHQMYHVHDGDNVVGTWKTIKGW